PEAVRELDAGELRDVLGVRAMAAPFPRKPENGVVVQIQKIAEGGLVTSLRSSYECQVIHPGFLLGLGHWTDGLGKSLEAPARNSTGRRQPRVQAGFDHKPNRKQSPHPCFILLSFLLTRPRRRRRMPGLRHESRVRRHAAASRPCGLSREQEAAPGNRTHPSSPAPGTAPDR